MKLTKTQKRALVHLEKYEGGWTGDTPVTQKCLNGLSKKGLVAVCFDPEKGYLEKLTPEGVKLVKGVDTKPLIKSVTSSLMDLRHYEHPKQPEWANQFVNHMFVLSVRHPLDDVYATAVSDLEKLAEGLRRAALEISMGSRK